MSKFASPWPGETPPTTHTPDPADAMISTIEPNLNLVPVSQKEKAKKRLISIINGINSDNDKLDTKILNCIIDCTNVCIKDQAGYGKGSKIKKTKKKKSKRSKRTRRNKKN